MDYSLPKAGQADAEEFSSPQKCRNSLTRKRERFLASFRKRRIEVYAPRLAAAYMTVFWKRWKLNFTLSVGGM